jgi:hypothetical protein
MTKARVRTFSAVDRDVKMLEAIAAYHGFSKSAMIASLVRKEFWRIFPAGTGGILPTDGAAVNAVSPARPPREHRKENDDDAS